MWMPLAEPSHCQQVKRDFKMEAAKLQNGVTRQSCHLTGRSARSPGCQI